MKSIIFTIFFVAVASAANDFCESPGVSENCCGSATNEIISDACTYSCSSRISHGNGTPNYDQFVEFTNDHLIRSFEYLFLSAQFGTHMKDRPGFEKVLHGLSDNAWGKGIEMIKESAKRGVSHEFNKTNVKDGESTAHGETSEVEAFALAAKIEKGLLEKANEVHRHHSHAAGKDHLLANYDAGIAQFLEEEIIEDKIDTVRTIVGHVNDLKNLFSDNKDLFPMSLYLFDQHLQK